MDEEDTIYRTKEEKELVIPQEKEHLVKPLAGKLQPKQLVQYNKTASMGYITEFITHLSPDHLEAALKKHIDDIEIEQG